jgi:periplasmic protein TonB
MFATLIESRALPVRRTGSSIASIVVHSAIIGSVTLLSARDTMTDAPAETRAKPVVFEVIRDLQPSHAQQAVADNFQVPAAATNVRISIPTVVPIGLPPVDLSLPQTPTDFRPSGPPGRIGGTCLVDCRPIPFSDAVGNELLTTRELMMRLTEDPVPPRYPEALRRAGVEGSVVVKFAVDTTGRVDMRSVEVLRSTHESFTAAVRETLARLKFRPSAVGDKSVRAMAVMPFQFTLK